MTDDVSEVLIVISDLGMFGREIGSLEKSHCIGQTPCSYERYLITSPARDSGGARYYNQFVHNVHNVMNS